MSRSGTSRRTIAAALAAVVLGCHSTASTKPGLPGAPLNVFADAGYGQAGVAWVAPLSDGNSTITAYTVTANPGGLTQSTTGETWVQFTGLTNGVSYTFTVVATNKIGNGPPSQPSSPVVPMQVPDPPTNVMATAGDGQATVTWTAPNDEGSPITGYDVASSPGGLQAWSSSGTTATVTGLTNGTSYTFTVYAENALGEGNLSDASNSVTPEMADGGLADGG